LHVDGLIGSAISIVIHSLKKPNILLIVLNNKEEAAYYLNDLEQIRGTRCFVLSRLFRRPYQIEETDNANVLLRAEVLNRINSQSLRLLLAIPKLCLKSSYAKGFRQNTLKVTVGDKISIDFINEVLFEYEFKRVDFITEPGEFSVRGGIVDVFRFRMTTVPNRVFGDEVESIRSFDVATQLSIENKKDHHYPNVEKKSFSRKTESFLDYILRKR
jgi:transcription-repair coupling factor (superfamily II helicase)